MAPASSYIGAWRCSSYSEKLFSWMSEVFSSLEVRLRKVIRGVVRLEGIEPPAFRSGARSVARPLAANDRGTLPQELR
jgi:hypothetical protein